IATLRSLSRGKPIGFKLCIGARTEFLSICKAILAVGVAPDFVVDGGEGGTGAAPQEFEDHVGMPLTEGLMLVHNSLVGAGLRDRIRVGASGKVASGVDIVSRVCQGADFTMSARAMMFAVGCIQALKCNTNHCPTGVATQDPARTRALNMPDKAIRVFNYQRATVASAAQIVASMGLNGFHELSPAMLNRRRDLRMADARRTARRPSRIVALGLDRGVGGRVHLTHAHTGGTMCSWTISMRNASGSNSRAADGAVAESWSSRDRGRRRG
ncbi:MAG: glutamate synthase, partial [Mycobacterium sp.]|nr:glutamate synthase [Mycobacterium sp.]